MLGDDVDRELAEACAEVESIGVVMRRFRRTGRGSPSGGSRVAAGRAIGEFIHRAEMDGANGKAILHGVIPTAVFGVASACHGAVVPDVRKSVAAARRIVKDHRIGTERALTTEGQRAEMRRRYTAIDFVIEGLAGSRAVDGVRIAAPGKAVVDDVSLGCVGEKAGLRIDASGSVEHNRPAGQKLFFAPDAQTRLLQDVRCY